MIFFLLLPSIVTNSKTREFGLLGAVFDFLLGVEVWQFMIHIGNGLNYSFSCDCCLFWMQGKEILYGALLSI